MSLEITGKVTRIGEIETFPSGFQKRELILTTEEQYPQPISIEFLKDKGDLLNALNVGDSLKVFINLGGRSWDNPQGETKYFNSITGWKIEKVGEDTHSAKPFNETPTVKGSKVTTRNETDPFTDEDDDLPF